MSRDPLPAGPWDAESVPVAFDAHGLKCLVLRGPLGALCGYVQVPNEHPLYGVDYSQPVPEPLTLAVKAAEESPIGKRGIVNVFCAASRSYMQAGDLFDVHGSITFSGCPHSVELPQEGFWYGFDCSHHNDLTPGLMRYGHDRNDTYRDLAYVRAEAESLALQLSRLQALVS